MLILFSNVSELPFPRCAGVMEDSSDCSVRGCVGQSFCAVADILPWFPQNTRSVQPLRVPLVSCVLLFLLSSDKKNYQKSAFLKLHSY